MTTQEENELLAEWAGIECRCTMIDDEWTDSTLRAFNNCPRHSNGGDPPDYDRDEVAISLLNDIPNWLLDKNPDEGFQLSIYGTFGPPTVIGEWSPTIAAAIKNAIKMLLEHKAS